MKRGGFTLLELVLVLFIIALATHMAVREVAKVRAPALHAAANAQLAAIRDAVFCKTSSGEPGGFLADMGRMPAAVDDGNGTLTLAELFSNPGGIGPYEARPASAENLAAGAPPQIADETVLVPCGWGGPYIAPPSAAAQRLRDPWGNPVETPDSAGLARVVATNAEGECRSGEPIAAVRHYGSDGMADSERTPASHEARDCEEALSRSDSAILLTFAPGSISKVCWYAPLGDKITGGSITVGADKSQLRISGMTPGIRFVKIFPTSGDAFVRQIPLWPGRDAVLEIADR